MSPRYSIRIGNEWVTTDYITYCRDNHLEKGHIDNRTTFEIKQALEITHNIPFAVLVPEPKKTLAVYYRGWITGKNKKQVQATKVCLGLLLKETEHTLVIQETTTNDKATILKSKIVKMVNV